MLPDRVSNPGPLTYESGALPIALRGPDFVGNIPDLNTVESTFKVQQLHLLTGLCYSKLM